MPWKKYELSYFLLSFGSGVQNAVLKSAVLSAYLALGQRFYLQRILIQSSATYLYFKVVFPDPCFGVESKMSRAGAHIKQPTSPPGLGHPPEGAAAGNLARIRL